MTRERFVELKTLPVEKVASLDRAVERAYVEVETDKTQVVVITTRIEVRHDRARGEVIGTMRQHYSASDRQMTEIGLIRDHQLVLPGTGVRSDSPSEEWVLEMVGSPRDGTGG